MKKYFGRSITILLVLILAQCANKEKKQIIGVWQLEQMDINGTRIDGHDMGRWLWEFNDEGGYLTNVAVRLKKAHTN
ncbi:MAG: hypothetical protein IPP77_02550 [Bacteroidetes bacterium]|nr:hypothetical protein [Bacteroidota bacterium]